MTPFLRVLLLELPMMLQEIVAHAISQTPDCHIVLESMLSVGVTGDHSPHVVIVGGGSGADAQRALALLARWPAARVVMLANRGERATVYELQPHRAEISDLSPTRFVEALRSAAHSSAGTLEWRELYLQRNASLFTTGRTNPDQQEKA